ncbi:oxygen-insensitive NADPH nitroreductase [Fusibacter ferrireducens]|uniref:Oxygen-insensitive NADPH nitroreductase n=1 Tax=Fusibacter ferrireducens TaxID=2785058 RepID=A0ABR9ZMK4_9FIRM|nr:oxygen-insensitive NADPH nitroreductase [Fusibacter ferrireducens]MBF4691688.1 oxygen-insensitive NADPH nitroreductase [Fusibacter ferrireducens]
MNDTLKLLKSHQSIRKFKADPIPKNFIDEIIEAAQMASTSSFLQAYSIVSIGDMVVRNEIAQLSGDQKYVTSAPTFFVFCADLHRLSMACKKHDVPYESGYTESFIIATVDTALAAENAILAAESLGLGGVFIGGIRNNPKRVSELLRLPEEVYPVFGMCLGFPDHAPGPKERLPRDVIFHEEVYKEADESLMNAYDERIRNYYIERTHGKKRASWTESVSEKMAHETRQHMKSFLEDKALNQK